MLGRTVSLQIRTPEGVTFSVPIASPISRCLAVAVDYAVVIALTMLIAQVLSIIGLSLANIPVIGDVISDFAGGAILLIQFIVFAGYGIVTEWLWSGRTVGKRLFRLRVIDERGLALGFKQVLIRNLFRFLDVLPSTFYLVGGISCFVTKRCQRTGDIAAGTLVIRETENAAPELSGVIGGGENSFSKVPHLEARLRQRTSPEEARIALDAISRRDELDPESRLVLFSRLADHFRERVDFPEEITIGLSDEQYVRNAVDSLFRRASA